MGEHKNKPLANIILAAIMVFALFMSFLAVKGLILELTG